MPVLVPASGFDQSLEEVAQRLDPFGRVEATRDDGRNGCRVHFLVDAPGRGQPTIARFEFVEWYDRSREGWLRTRYKFEYRPLDSRKAHHDHGPWSFHQHCAAPGKPNTDHFADDERLLLPTAELLFEAYARSEPIWCGGLRKLPRRRGSDQAEASVRT